MTETADGARAAVTGGVVQHTHRDVNAGRLRPAVFGAMDGVISNGALIAGVAAGGGSAHTVILSGFAGLLGGAFSMAVGEWTSVQSQAELVQREIDKERAEIKRHPDAEEAELAAMLRHRGISRQVATEAARELSSDPDETWRTHVREELGVDPDKRPSPYVAAIASFVTFSVGAIVPLVPYLIGLDSVVWTFLLCGIALLAIGATVATFTDRSPVMGAFRHLALGGIAIAVVFGVGSAIGTGVSG